MALKKRSRVRNDCKQTLNKARKRIKRENETYHQRQLRLHTDRITTAASRLKKMG